MGVQTPAPAFSGSLEPSVCLNASLKGWWAAGTRNRRGHHPTGSPQQWVDMALCFPPLLYRQFSLQSLYNTLQLSRSVYFFAPLAKVQLFHKTIVPWPCLLKQRISWKRHLLAGNPGKLPPVNRVKTGLDGPLVWLNVRQLCKDISLGWYSTATKMRLQVPLASSDAVSVP